MAFSLRSLFTSGSHDSERIIGVDFGASSVKVVELEHSDSDIPVLKTYGELQLGPYNQASVGALVELDFEQKKEALVDVMRESQVESRQGVFVMPLRSSFVTPMTITGVTAENFDAKVRVEARKYIPVPLTDVKLEWVDITDDTVTGKDLHELLLVAIQNEILEEQRRLMDSVGMSAQPSEIECFSLMRAVQSDEPADVAIIDFGAQTSKLYIANGTDLLRIHRVRAGGHLVTERLKQLYNLSFEDAELLKRTTAAKPADADVRQTLVSVFDRSLQEFARAISQYEARTGRPLQAVYVAGATAKMHTLLDLTRDALQREVTLANPFAKVSYPPFLEDTLVDIGPNFAVALGAAFRSL